MPRIQPAGLAEHPGSVAFYVQITQIFFIEKGTALLILAKRAFLPVNFIVQAAAKPPFCLSVFFQRSGIDHNLPPCAASIRTVPADTCKLLIVVRNDILHVVLLFYVTIFQSRNTYCFNRSNASFTRLCGSARFIRIWHAPWNGRPSCQITPTSTPALCSSSMVW